MSETTYPESPGWKATDTETSRQAATAMRTSAKTLRERCLVALGRCPMTADEVAAAVEASVLAVRPRVSELKVLGRVEATTRRRCNVSGKSAVVWQALPVQVEMFA